MADLTPKDTSVPEPANDIAIKPKVSGEKRRRLRRWINRITWALIILAPLTFAVAAIGYKIGAFDLGFALFTLTRKVGPALLAGSVLFSLLSFVFAWIVKPQKGFLVAAIAMIVPALGGMKLAKAQKTFASVPFIHDVSTDTQDPPFFGTVIAAERAAIEGVNTDVYIGKTAPVFENGEPTKEEKLVSVLQTKAFPEIRPLVLSDKKDVVFGEALATAKSMGWTIKEEDLETGRIDATDTTFWYGFEDDISIRLRDGKGGGTIVDVRSLSRIGGSDLGKNAERVGEFLERLAK